MFYLRSDFTGGLHTLSNRLVIIPTYNEIENAEKIIRKTTEFLYFGLSAGNAATVAKGWALRTEGKD